MANFVTKRVIRDEHDKWVAINLGTRFALRALTIGLLVHFLSAAEIAAWYVFVALFGLVALAEGGLGRVVTRLVAERLKANVDTLHGRSDRYFISAILRSYLYLVVGVVGIAFLVGYWWLKGHVDPEQVPWLKLSWVIFVLANGLVLYGSLYSAILNGLGKVNISQKNETYSSLVNFIVFIIVSKISLSVLVPSVALFFSALVLTLKNRATLYSMYSVSSPAKGNPGLRYIKSVLVRMAPEFGKNISMLLAYHLLMSAFILMIDHYQDDRTLAAYGVTMQVVTMVIAFSNIWLTSSFPKMAAEKHGDSKRLRSLFISVITRSMGMLIFGMLMLVLFGDFALGLISAEISILPRELLLIVLSAVAIEYFFITMLGQLLISQSKMRFIKFTVLGSVVICLVSLILFGSGSGVADVFLARLILFLCIVSFPILSDSLEVFRTHAKNAPR